MCPCKPCLHLVCLHEPCLACPCEPRSRWLSHYRHMWRLAWVREAISFTAAVSGVQSIEESCCVVNIRTWTQNRQFKTEWTGQFCFSMVSLNKPMCLICNEVVKVLSFHVVLLEDKEKSIACYYHTDREVQGYMEEAQLKINVQKLL
ncbi:hypothetical protein PR048_004223 [Dryococelus australis]|uniref:Uncharacterized protein n=1 Tax=Dryococelus australis TaxID=614101 RepID=A0ABQ9I4W0_9NEOP|nr:hypothetical protein PR048_004223 [Dryococelus australis]